MTKYVHDDNDGRGLYRLDNLTSPGVNGYKYEYKGYQPSVNGWRCPIDKMEQFDKQGLIAFPKVKTGRLQFKRYLDTSKGTLVGNIWTDITVINSQAKERIGYPTQKPEALMERIINMASNEGDIVFDPFVGGGTTVSVANRLNRKWIGIDQSVMAVKVSEMRLNKQSNLFTEPYIVVLHKYDFDTIRTSPPFAFESFIITMFRGHPNSKQVSDFGIDGKTAEGTPIQVKRSANIGRNVIDNFKSAVIRADKKIYDKNVKSSNPVGYVIAFSFNKGAIEEVARLKMEENIIIKLVKVEDIIPIASKPKLKVECESRKSESGQWEIEFTAFAESGDGIEFYSWDFDYTPVNVAESVPALHSGDRGRSPLQTRDTSDGFQADIMVDKIGKQMRSFAPGEHHIAVKVYDVNGLENMEVIKLRVNGDVQRLS
jgi:hypothetical protein